LPTGNGEPLTVKALPLSVNVPDGMAAISQGGLDLWFEQAPDFLAGRQRCV
jgi:hypothetical protein